MPMSPSAHIALRAATDTAPPIALCGASSWTMYLTNIAADATCVHCHKKLGELTAAATPSTDPDEAEVVLVYTTTVYVTVDLAQRKVVRVRALDEDAEYSGTAVGQVPGWARDRALTIAQDGPSWPQWSVG